jgi:hypothetical protein
LVFERDRDNVGKEFGLLSAIFSDLSFHAVMYFSLEVCNVNDFAELFETFCELFEVLFFTDGHNPFI